MVPIPSLPVKPDILSRLPVKDVTINGADVTGQNFSCLITFSVSGTVTSGGVGLSGVAVNLTGAATQSTTTDSNGYYSFSGLFNGAYTITPSKAGYTFTPPSKDVTISGADITGQNFAATFSVSGTVTSGGAPFPGVDVSLKGAATQSTTTDGNGNYSFSGLLNGGPYTITPSKAGYTFTPPSIDVFISGADVTGQNFTAPLGAAILGGPSGPITTSTPSYKWNAVPGSTWYYLWVNDSTGNKITKWYSKEQAGCPGGTEICTVSPGIVLAPGSYTWWIQTWAESGYGPWSKDKTFTTVPPDKATLVSPPEPIPTSTPSYKWNAVPGSTWYYLYVNDSTGNKITKWYSKEQAGCPGVSENETCTASPGTVLAPGSGIWWVQTYGENGYGPWSDGMSFTVPPGKAALISPKETISGNTPPYSWHAVPGSTSYYLYVNDSTGNKIKKWYSKEQAGCPGGTETEICTASPGTVLAPGSGIWWVQTWAENGYGPWSDGTNFTVSVASGFNQ